MRVDESHSSTDENIFPCQTGRIDMNLRLLREFSMKIDHIEVENFKCFEKLKFSFDNLSVFVGENNSGKSAIFAAIDRFFGCSNKYSSVTIDDFHINSDGEKSNNLKIILRFSDLSEDAISTFSEYTSSNTVTFKLESVRTEEAIKTTMSGVRSGMTEFSDAFSYSKETPISKFNDEYVRLHKIHNDLPSPKEARNKDLKITALREYEVARPNQCVDIVSNDEAYGTVGPVPKLKQYIKWIFIPAVKDASDEANEGRNVLTELVSFAARRKTNFDERIHEIQKKVAQELVELQEDQQSTLDTITDELNINFQQISMGKERVELNWEHNVKDLRVEPPRAAAKIISGQHKGSIGLFGHGLQRNYLVSLFKVIASMQTTEKDDLTLIVGFEEPELYQHPPQARLMSRYLMKLSTVDQVFVTTHSSMFIHADFFGKLHRVINENGKTKIISVTLTEFMRRMNAVFDIPSENISSTLASLYTLINLSITEIFFSKFVVLVEGLEDIGYLEAITDHYDKRSNILELGINFIPVHGKNDLILVIELCKAFQIGYFVMFDGDIKHSESDKATKDNTAKTNKRLFNQLNIENNSGYLENSLLGANFQVWADNIKTDIISAYPCFESDLEEATVIYQAKHKNPKLVYHACKQQLKKNEVDCLSALLERIIECASKLGDTNAVS